MFSKDSPEASAYTAFGLGTLFGAGAMVAAMWRADLGFFMMLLGVYHLWEWTFVALFHPIELSVDSFLINHSPEWMTAWIICMCEFAIESAFFPWIKNHAFVVLPALALAVFGQACRTVAMFTAGSNFAHQIEEHKRQDHRLVTWGIYSLSRHPSYFGWFWWTVATQFLLANPITAVAFTVVAWKFFRDRINYEEVLLRHQFGDEYIEYSKRVSVGIPFL